MEEWEVTMDEKKKEENQMENNKERMKEEWLRNYYKMATFSSLTKSFILWNIHSAGSEEKINMNSALTISGIQKSSIVQSAFGILMALLKIIDNVMKLT